jgi:membrane-associated protein
MPDIHLPSAHEVLVTMRAFYEAYGYPLVFLGALLANMLFIGTLLPGGTLAALGGFFARRGGMDIRWVILCVWLGLVMGFNLDYLVGRLMLRRFADRWMPTRLGRWLRLEQRLARGHAFMNRHGGKAIFLAYATLGHMRSLVAVTGGMTRLSYARFLLVQMVAGLLWSCGYCLFGYFIGVETENLEPIVQRVGIALAAVLFVCYLVWSIHRARTRHHGDIVFGHLFVPAAARADARASEARALAEVVEVVDRSSRGRR